MPSCSCPGTDAEPWNPACAIHTIGHYHQPGCCDVPQAEGGLYPHRHMTAAEYNHDFPVVFDEKFQIGDRWWQVDARDFRGKIGATVTQLFEEDADSGLCFDLSEEAIRPVAEALTRLVGVLPAHS